MGWLLPLPLLAGCFWNNKPGPALTVKTEIQATTQCCVCDVSFSNDVQLDDYFGKTNCENRNGKPPFKNCRKVAIEERSCQRILRARDGSCTLNPIHFTENGVRQTLAPPPHADFKCRNPDSQAIEDENAAEMNWREDDSTEFTPDNYCTCEIDPINDAQCRVILIQNGITTVLETKPRQPHMSCTRDECMELFNQENFRNNCPTYRDAAP